MLIPLAHGMPIRFGSNGELGLVAETDGRLSFAAVDEVGEAEGRLTETMFSHDELVGVKVQMPAGPPGMSEPLGDLRGLVGRQVVEDNMHIQPAGHRAVDLLEEGQHIRGGVLLAALGDDLTGGDVQRREQVGRPVPLVVMGHRPSPAPHHRQTRLGPVQRLTLGILREASIFFATELDGRPKR